jgi:undecaprenyl-diphosphatase
VAWFPAIQSLDEAILAAAHGAPAFAVPLFHVLTVVGGGWAMFFLLPFLVRRASRPVTLWLLGAVVGTSALVSLTKLLVGRVRPCDALGWCPPIAVLSPHGPSFPSGHSAGSFAFAMFIAVRFPRWAAPALIYAGLVAWSRCVLGVHYPSDVFVGALLGSLIGGLMARRSLRSASSPEADVTSAKA